MELKNSISITLSKFNILFQTVIYIAIVFFIVALIMTCVLIPVGQSVSNDAVVVAEKAEIKAVWQSFMDSETTLRDLVSDVGESIDSMWNHVKTNTNFVARIIVTCLVGYYLLKYLLSLINLPIAHIVDSFMSSCLKYGFLSAFFKNFRKSALISLFYTLICGTYNLGVGIMLFYIIKALLPSIGIFAFTIAFVMWLCLFSLRATVFSGWTPYYLHSSDGKLWKALKDSFGMVHARWHRIIITMICVYVLAYLIIAVLALPSFFVFPVFGYALVYLAMRTQEMTFYYAYNKKNYYLDPRTVVDSREIADRTEYQQ